MNGKDYIFVKNLDKVMYRIYHRDIILIMANKDYCRIVTADKMYVVHFTMNAILTVLPENMFCRCNRSTIVNVDKIERIEKNILHVGSSSPDLSEQYRDELFRKINFVSKKTV